MKEETLTPEQIKQEELNQEQLKKFLAVADKTMRKFYYYAKAFPNSRVSKLQICTDIKKGDTAWWNSHDNTITFSKRLLEYFDFKESLLEFVLNHETAHSSFTFSWIEPKEYIGIAPMIVNHLEDWRLNTFLVGQFPHLSNSTRECYEKLDSMRLESIKEKRKQVEDSLRAEKTQEELIQKELEDFDKAHSNNLGTEVNINFIVQFWSGIGSLTCYTNFEDQYNLYVDSLNLTPQQRELVDKVTPHILAFQALQPEFFDTPGNKKKSLISMFHAREILKIFKDYELINETLSISQIIQIINDILESRKNSDADSNNNSQNGNQSGAKGQEPKDGQGNQPGEQGQNPGSGAGQEPKDGQGSGSGQTNESSESNSNQGNPSGSAQGKTNKSSKPDSNQNSSSRKTQEQSKETNESDTKQGSSDPSKEQPQESKDNQNKSGQESPDQKDNPSQTGAQESSAAKKARESLEKQTTSELEDLKEKLQQAKESFGDSNSDQTPGESEPSSPEESKEAKEEGDKEQKEQEGFDTESNDDAQDKSHDAGGVTEYLPFEGYASPEDLSGYDKFMSKWGSYVPKIARLFANARSKTNLEQGHKSSAKSSGHRLRIRSVARQLSNPKQDAKIFYSRTGDLTKGKSTANFEDILIGLDCSGSMDYVRGMLKVITGLTYLSLKKSKTRCVICATERDRPKLINEGKKLERPEPVIANISNLRTNGDVDMANGSVQLLRKEQNKSAKPQNSRLVIISDCAVLDHDARQVAATAKEIGYPVCVIAIAPYHHYFESCLKLMPDATFICIPNSLTEPQMIEFMGNFASWMSDPESFERISRSKYNRKFPGIKK